MARLELGDQIHQHEGAQMSAESDLKTALQTEFENLDPNKTAEDAATSMAAAIAAFHAAAAGEGTHVQVYRATSQLIATGGTIIFTTEVTDALGEYDPVTGLVTLAANGVYDASWGVLMASRAWAAGGNFVAYLSVDGATGDPTPPAQQKRFMPIRWQTSVAATDYASSHGSVQGIPWSAAQTLEIKVAHTAGAAINTYNSPGWVWWQVRRVA
jgi:hypothetical protein